MLPPHATGPAPTSTNVLRVVSQILQKWTPSSRCADLQHALKKIIEGLLQPGHDLIVCTFDDRDRDSQPTSAPVWPHNRGNRSWAFRGGLPTVSRPPGPASFYAGYPPIAGVLVGVIRCPATWRSNSTNVCSCQRPVSVTCPKMRHQHRKRIPPSY